MAMNGIVAIGLTFVIVVRRFDLSLSGVGSLAAMTLGFVVGHTNEFYSMLLSAIGVGILFGLINGLLVGRARLPDVVTTIGVGSIAYALAFAYNGGSTYAQNFFTSGLINFSFETILGVQKPVFALILTTLVCGYLLHATRLGNALYATGENPVASQFSGLNISRYIMIAFAICGALVGFAMVLQVSGSGQSRISAGSQLMLPAYTSVYLGAALMGRPSVLATTFGVTIMTMLVNGFTLLSVPYYYSDAIVSLVLILAITLFDPAIFASIAKRFTPETQSKVA